MRKSFFQEKSPISAKASSHTQLSLNSPKANHKRTRTFDIRNTKLPENNEYQLENKFASLSLLKRKDSCPIKSETLKELLSIKDSPQIKTTKTQGEVKNAMNKSIPNNLKTKKESKKSHPICTEFLKDLTKIYDSNFKPSKTFREYESFRNAEYSSLGRNLKSISAIEEKDLHLSKESFLSEEHRQMLAQTIKNYETNKAEMLILYPDEEFAIELQKGRFKHMMVRYNTGFHATRVFFTVFKGSFMAFIGRNPKPDKEKHDFMFSINSFVIDYKHQISQINDLFLSVFALTDLKATIKIEFPQNNNNMNKKFNEQAPEITRTRNNSLPAISQLDSFDSLSKNERSIQKSSKNSKRPVVVVKDEYFLKSKQEEMERKVMKVRFRRDQQAIQMLFEKKISMMKRLQRKDENERKRIELEMILLRRILKINWIFLITLVNTVGKIRRIYLATKAVRAFQKLQVSKARVIQKKFKEHMLKSKGFNRENYMSCSASILRMFYIVTEKKVKHRAKRVILKFLRHIKPPLIIRIKFFKLLAKIITIQARWRLHCRSFNDKSNELRQIWDKSFRAYSEFKGFECNEELKSNIIKQHLLQRLNVFYQEMREYLHKVKSQNRAKTLALRFLVTAQKKNETSEEREIRNLKRNSVFLFPSMEIPKNKSSIAKNKSTFGSYPLKKDKIKETVVEEEKSGSSSNSEQSDLTPEKKANGLNLEHADSKKSALDENAVIRPVLKYIPEDSELRAMIRKAVSRKK